MRNQRDDVVPLEVNIDLTVPRLKHNTLAEVGVNDRLSLHIPSNWLVQSSLHSSGTRRKIKLCVSATLALSETSFQLLDVVHSRDRLL